MDLTFLAQADVVALQFERAKRALEVAKADFETARGEYDMLLSRADENGIPKPKLKKLVEDRVAALIETGVVDLQAPAKESKKPARAKSAKVSSKDVEPQGDVSGALADAEFESESETSMSAN